jgi:hypothetical protein
MAAAPRPNNKATRILYSVLGRPPNLVKLTKRQKMINDRLKVEESSRLK